MAEEFPTVNQQFDPWHVIKGTTPILLKSVHMRVLYLRKLLLNMPQNDCRTFIFISSKIKPFHEGLTSSCVIFCVFFSGMAKGVIKVYNLASCKVLQLWLERIKNQIWWALESSIGDAEMARQKIESLFFHIQVDEDRH